MYHQLRLHTTPENVPNPSRPKAQTTTKTTIVWTFFKSAPDKRCWRLSFKIISIFRMSFNQKLIPLFEIKNNCPPVAKENTTVEIVRDLYTKANLLYKSKLEPKPDFLSLNETMKQIDPQDFQKNSLSINGWCFFSVSRETSSLDI